MSVVATLQTKLSVIETLEGNTASAPTATRKVTHSAFNTDLTIDASSTVPATKVAAFEQAMTAGAATIDLTALVGTNGAAVTFLGLKVQAIKFINKVTNANTITIVQGAANGYGLLGATFSLTLPPGGEATFYLKDQTPDVAAGAKTLDITGTLAQVLQVIAVAG